MNVERNGKLYEFWKQGKTIRETALQSGVPEGTVAYYWNKFNRAAVAGRPIPIGSPSSDRSPDDGLLNNSKLKNDLLKTTMQMVADGKGEKIKYALETVERLQKLGLLQTREDSVAAFNQIMGELKNTSVSLSPPAGLQASEDPTSSPSRSIAFKTLRWTPPPLSDPFVDDQNEQ
jgi:hypothetical protein